MVVRHFILAVGLSLLTLVVQAQWVEVIHEFTEWKVADDMAVTDSGYVYICGNENNFPFIVKLDSNGQVIWDKAYTDYYEPNSYFGYTRITALPDGGAVVAGSANYSDDTYLVQRIDANGNRLWQTRNLTGFMVNLNRDGNMLLVDNNRVILLSLDYSGTWISALNLANGEIIEEKTLTSPSLYLDFTAPYINNEWVLASSRDKVVYLSPSLEIREQQLNNRLHRMITATDNGYIGFDTIHIDPNGTFYSPYIEPIIVYYDTNWEEQVVHNFWPDTLTHAPDTLDMGFNSIVPLKNQGLLGIGTLRKGTQERIGYFAQINPDNASIVKDTLVHQIDAVRFLEANSGTAFAVGQIYSQSRLGVRVFKIHPETISFNTVFTATEDLIQTESVWRVYPNPTSNNFTLESEEQLDWIKIYDLTGKLIYTNNAPQFSNEIPLDQAGVYIVQVGGKNSISIQKMVRL